ncbi:hypothetical protein RHGRI_027846 [Rhododendron griersonianum]|uniref:Uncharacterized protein n=1 Tax=Rhododendron griersonianum TaxID=479676 RepID=A0AAV6J2M9_9ERIC|nr:hypothetical protein RHGRI_027846 [Rhododendron griersonianum]
MIKLLVNGHVQQRILMLTNGGISDDEYSDISRGGGNGFATQKGNTSSQKPTLRKRSIFKASDLSLKRNQKGPMNQELKIWTLASEEGWLLNAEAWHCTQTLDLENSFESQIEESFLNQVVTLSQAGLLLIANAKKNAVCYTVRTQAIQQYDFNLSQCLPPPLESMVSEKSDLIVTQTVCTYSDYENEPMMRHISSSGSMDATTFADPSSLESRPIALPTVSSNIDISCVASPPLPLSPRLSKKLSSLRSPTNGFEPGPVVDDCGRDPHIVEYSVDGQMDSLERIDFCNRALLYKSFE